MFIVRNFCDKTLIKALEYRSVAFDGTSGREARRAVANLVTITFQQSRVRRIFDAFRRAVNPGKYIPCVYCVTLDNRSSQSRWRSKDAAIGAILLPRFRA